MDNKQIAKEVIDALGGRENVNSVAHCATRLRVMVKDENKINKEKAENIEKVQGAFFNSGQYQIIFGTIASSYRSDRSFHGYPWSNQ